MRKVYRSAQAVKASVPTGKTITLVGGSFDLLHIGHLHLFERSKKFENLLVVCVLSDSNVKSYKGSTRPVVGEDYRAAMIAALRCVDRVFISDIDTSHQDTLSALQPNSVVFGIEDNERHMATMRKRERFIKSNFPDIKIQYLDRFPDNTISTSDLIRKIITSYSNE